jgi:hypothetical protein
MFKELRLTVQNTVFFLKKKYSHSENPGSKEFLALLPVLVPPWNCG